VNKWLEKKRTEANMHLGEMIMDACPVSFNCGFNAAMALAEEEIKPVVDFYGENFPRKKYPESTTDDHILKRWAKFRNDEGKKALYITKRWWSES